MVSSNGPLWRTVSFRSGHCLYTGRGGPSSGFRVVRRYDGGAGSVEEAAGIGIRAVRIIETTAKINMTPTRDPSKLPHITTISVVLVEVPADAVAVAFG